MDEQMDPLDRLRKYASPDFNDSLDALQELSDREHEAGRARQVEIAKLTAERDELQAKLDASMPLPLDVDGVVIRLGDIVKDGEDAILVEELDLSAIGWKVWLDDWGDPVSPSDLTHVIPTPKPETIEDVRGDISNDPCGYFGKGSATSCDGCPRDGKGGGCSRAMSADLVRRAYECGQRDGVEK